MNFQSLQNDLKDWLKKTAGQAAGAAEKAEKYLGVTRPVAPPNPIQNPKGFAKEVLVNQPIRTVKNIVNPVIEGMNVISSYPLGGSVRAMSEMKQGTYKAPQLGFKVFGRDAGEFLNPSVVGAARGIKNKQPLFEEVPKAAGVKNPIGAFALGLGAEIAAPGIGPGEKRAATAALDKTKKLIRKGLDADQISDILEKTMKKTPERMADKPNRLVGEKLSFREAMTGLATNGENLLGRIRVAIDDNGKLLIEDGTHLLEAYRQLKLPVPKEKIAFQSTKVKAMFVKALKEGALPKVVKPKAITPPFTGRQQGIAKQMVKIGADGIDEKPPIDLRSPALTEPRKPGDIMNYPTILRSIGFNKKEIDRIGINEAERIAGLAKLGYPKKEIQNMDWDRMDQILKKQVPFSSLKDYYVKKHSLDTNFLRGVKSEDLKDINPIMGYARDVYRNLEVAFGPKIYPRLKQELLDPLDDSVASYVDDAQKWEKLVEENIVKKLGIKDRTKESAAVQLFGEKKMGLDVLQAQFPKTWQNIVKASEWFRNAYDQMLPELNAVREANYPTHPLFPESTKVIPERADYFRHFREQTDSFKGLMNIMDDPSNISPELAANSAETRPLTKFLGFAQRRTGEETDVDAVAGFLSYIRPWSYAKHVDPMIQKFRGVDTEAKAENAQRFFHETKGFIEELSKAADERGTSIAEYAPNKLNNLLLFLKNFSNSLAGKTNPADRPVQEIISRQGFKVLNYVNNRVKSNTIVGSMGSLPMQLLGIPAGMAQAGPVASTAAIGDTILDAFRMSTHMAKSGFLKERKFDPITTFNPKLMDRPKELAVWLLKTMDSIQSNYVWNAQYRRAVADGVKDPIRVADDLTKRVIAGRGIGQVPLIHASKVGKIILPFQLEVGNFWNVLGDWKRDGKLASRLMTYAATVYALNAALKNLTGKDGAFDPIDAMMDAYNEAEDGNYLQAGGRVLGEFLSNMPGGGIAAALYPEYGAKWAEQLTGQNVTRAELFGEKDPTRFGTGGLPLAAKAITDPVTKFILPYGGGQLERSKQGLGTLIDGGLYNKEGGLKFPVGDELSEKLKVVVFGPYAAKAAQFYSDNGLSPLTQNESAYWEAQVQKGDDPIKAWTVIQTAKVSRGLRTKMRDIMRDATLDIDEKNRRVEQAKKEYDELMGRLQSYQP